MSSSDYNFVIATHSDHFINRFRILIKNGKIPHTDVSIVYCEPNEDNKFVRIHNIKLDEYGDMVNPPWSYREFFIDEVEHLLGP